MIKRDLLWLFSLTLSATLCITACKDEDDSEDSGKYNVKQYGVDLGLPSGTLWAKMNVGAEKSWERGDSFAWGETTTKSEFTWENYLHMAAGKADKKFINKYQIDNGSGSWYNAEFIGDGKTTLDAVDDAAAVNWGGDWETPSPADFQELFDNCQVKTISTYEKYGVLLTGSNGNSIYIGKTGQGWKDGILPVANLWYWTNSLSKNNTKLAYRIELNSFICSTFEEYREAGYPIRPVCKTNGDTQGHEAVDLGLPSGKLWATCNIGATDQYERGDFFAWGETKAKQNFDIDKEEWNKYQVEDENYHECWYNAEFIGDGKTTLEAGDDAATTNWGGKWKMPTIEQQKELVKECCWIWTIDYNNTGSAGFIAYKAKVEGDKGKIVDANNAASLLESYTYDDIHIFLPAQNDIVVYDADISRTQKEFVFCAGNNYWGASLGEVGSDHIIETYVGSTLSFYIEGDRLIIINNSAERFNGGLIRPVYCK